jgi:hypothetical protein
MEEQNRTCPDSNLVWAILCTILCCLPLGIVAIIKASSVEKLWLQGRYEEAIKASNDAKKFSIIGAVVSAIGIVIYLLIYVIIIAAAVSSY